MIVQKRTHRMLNKAIAMVLTCLFCIDTLSFAASDTLAPSVSNPQIWQAMRRMMEEKLASHQQPIDDFIKDRANRTKKLSAIPHLEEELARCVEDCGASNMLSRLKTTLTAAGGQIQIIFVDSEDELPVFDGKKVWGHAGKYITVFALKNEEGTQDGRRKIIGRLFHEIRARSTKAKELFDQEFREEKPSTVEQIEASIKSSQERFEKDNLRIQDEVTRVGRIENPRLAKEFTELIFAAHPHVINRDYAMGKKKIPAFKSLTDAPKPGYYIVSERADWSKIFEDNSKPIKVEIGFGDGDYLLKMARRDPAFNYIGIESNAVFINGFASRLEKRARPVKNLKLIHADDYIAFLHQKKKGLVCELYYIMGIFSENSALNMGGQGPMTQLINDILAPGGKIFISSDGRFGEHNIEYYFRKAGFIDVTRVSTFPHGSEFYQAQWDEQYVFQKPENEHTKHQRRQPSAKPGTRAPKGSKFGGKSMPAGSISMAGRSQKSSTNGARPAGADDLLREKLVIRSKFEGGESARKEQISGLIDRLLSAMERYGPGAARTNSWDVYDQYTVNSEGRRIEMMSGKSYFWVTCDGKMWIVSKEKAWNNFHGRAISEYDSVRSILRELFNLLRGDELEFRCPVQFENAEDDYYWNDWYSAKGPEDGFYAYDVYRKSIDPLVTEIVKTALSNVAPDKETCILDIFSGDGSLVKELDKSLKSSLGSRRMRYVLIDRNTILCRKARKRLEGLQAKVINKDLARIDDFAKLIKRRPWCVTAIGGLQDKVVNHADAENICGKIFRLLPDGGIFIVSGYWPSRLNSDDFRRIGFDVINMTVPHWVSRDVQMSQCYILRKPVNKPMPPGSIYSVFKYLDDNGISSALAAVSGEAIARQLDRNYKYVIRRDISALHYLGLIDTEDIDASGKPGKSARWFVPENVKKKLEDAKTKTMLFELLFGFKKEKLRPTRAVLDVYRGRINQILSMVTADIQARNIVEIMRQNEVEFEVGLDVAREYLEKEGLNWHAIRMVWRALRNYSSGGHLLKDKFEKDAPSLAQTLRTILLEEKFWYVYMTIRKETNRDDVAIDKMKERLSQVMSAEECDETICNLKSSQDLIITSDGAAIRANFEQLGKKLGDTIGIPVPEYLRSPDQATCEEEILNDGICIGNMETSFGRYDVKNNLSRNYQQYEMIRARALGRIRQADGKPFNIIVIGSSNGVQGYDAAMACADAIDEAGVKIPINVIITDAQTASIDYGKRGIYAKKFVERSLLSSMERAQAQRRIAKFFLAKGDNELAILSARTFKERWGITLGFEKTDILDDHDIARAFLAGPYDLVIANNVHYAERVGINGSAKNDETVFHSNICRLLSESGEGFLSMGIVPRSTVAILPDFINENVFPISKIESRLSFYLYVAAAIYKAMDKSVEDIHNAIAESSHSEKISWVDTEDAMFVLMATDWVGRDKKRDLLRLLLRDWVNDKYCPRDMFMDARKGVMNALFSDTKEFTAKAKEKIETFLKDNIDILKEVIPETATGEILNIREALGEIQNMLPEEWQKNELMGTEAIKELSHIIGLPDNGIEEKSTLIFSEMVTFKAGLGLLLEKVAKSNPNRKIVVIATNDREKAFIDGLNSGKAKDDRIMIANSVLDAWTKVHTRKAYYFKMKGDPKPDITNENITVFDITDKIEVIMNALGRLSGITEPAKLELLRSAMHEFGVAA